MIQSQVSREVRLELANKILLIKAKKDLSFAQLVEGTGLSEAFVTAALLGQHQSSSAIPHREQPTSARFAETAAIMTRFASGKPPGGSPQSCRLQPPPRHCAGRAR